MSDMQNVMTPVGSVGRPAGPQPLDQLAGRLRPARGIRGQAEPDRGLELLGLRGVDALPGRQHARTAARR